MHFKTWPLSSVFVYQGQNYTMPPFAIFEILALQLQILAHMQMSNLSMAFHDQTAEFPQSLCTLKDMLH